VPGGKVKSNKELLDALLKCHTRKQVLDVLRLLGDDDSVSIDQPFGANKLRWRAFGDKESNISTIGLSTKAGKSLTERITNAIDALLEERAQQAKTESLPESPRLAAQEWFGRPMSGPDSGLFQGLPSPVDSRIAVALLPSGVEDGPTVDVLDQGCGLSPTEFPKTILSLQAGNKIRKRHQIGAFGQGGSSTLGFSDYVIIISRSRSNQQIVGFTLIRVLKLDQSYKEDCYAYLTGGDGNVFSVDLAGEGQSGLTLYPSVGSQKPPELTKGTLVRHIGYRLSGIAKALAPSPGNLYHYLHYSLFDPVLPFRVWDFRNESKPKSEYVGGARNRLMKAAIERQQESDDDMGGNRVHVKHHRPMEYIVPAGAEKPCIGIEYWVVLALKKNSEGNLILRSNSAELYVQPHHPIVGTLNGQTQGELTGLMFKELGLGLLARHTIVHIDASAADTRVRRELFSTSREGFKEGPILDSIVFALRKMLDEDEELDKIESELTERLAKRDTEATKEEVKKQVTRLLKEAGLHVSESARSDVEGKGDRRIVTRQRRKPYRKRDPLPTLPFPNVTFVRFAAPEQHLEVHLQDSELVLIETDADAEFDRRGLIGIASTDDLLMIDSKSNLSGGRIRWRLRPSDAASAGATGELRVFLTKPNGVQLNSSISFEVLPAKERPAKVGKTEVPPFDIQPVSPSDAEKWGLCWPDDDGDDERQQKHAYIAMDLAGKTWVYYSTVFPPFATTLERLKLSAPELVEPFTTAYEVWIAYHAILQKQAEEAAGLDGASDDKLDDIMDVQRAVVATMQVKQAQQFAELWKKGLAAAHSD
jgi:hypothetical protein